MAFLSRLGGSLKSALKPSRVSSVAALPAAYILTRGYTAKLFIGGLAWGTDENGLRDAFQSFGNIVEVRVIQDRETGRSRGFGFVSYVTDQEAQKAMEAMDGRVLDGRTVRVNYATQRQPGSFGGGDGGYGGGGGYASGGGAYGSGGGGEAGGDMNTAAEEEEEPRAPITGGGYGVTTGGMGAAASGMETPPSPPSPGYGVTTGGYGVSGGGGGYGVSDSSSSSSSTNEESRGYGAF